MFPWINQYWTGLKCVNYSVTQVKTQLHEKMPLLIFQFQSQSAYTCTAWKAIYSFKQHKNCEKECYFCCSTKWRLGQLLQRQNSVRNIYWKIVRLESLVKSYKTFGGRHLRWSLISWCVLVLKSFFSSLLFALMLKLIFLVVLYPRAIFTTLQFLHNLQIGQIS